MSISTERDRMLRGELYDPFDPELVRARSRARDLCQALNATREQQDEERRRILRQLFGRGGDTVWMQPPFFCDYGMNIYTVTHPLDAQLRRRQEFAKPIEIGSDVWVGGGAILCPGVRIGSRAVIGAGSVVTRDIPDAVLAAGNPCRVIRSVDDGEDVLSV